ncbi:MAG: 50S ribosomal protein L24 [Clostridiaceae bacterium]|nr:50S ribosomal protein L24 [Clostridiaceae bacterium]
MRNKVHVKVDDVVYILTGKDREKKGKVLEVDPRGRKVTVENVNMVKRHTKPRRADQPGGIVEKEAPIDSSNVMLVCPRCSRPTKVGKAILENGQKARVCKKCDEIIDIIREAK